jgi:hypothetical protein
VSSAGIVTFHAGDHDILTRREARNLEKTGNLKVVGDPVGRVDVAVEIEWDEDAAAPSS